MVFSEKFIRGYKGDFAKNFPLHAEAIDILNNDAGLKPNRIIFNGRTTAAHNLTKTILYDLNELKNGSLQEFVFRYAHELGHIKNRFSKSTIIRTLLSSTSKSILSTGIILGVGMAMDGQCLDAPFAVIAGGIPYAVLKGINNTLVVGKNEHEQNLFAYNTTGILPSKGIYGSKKLNEKEIKEGCERSGYPLPSEMDEYVLEKGNPNPATRLLELLKMDATFRANKAELNIHSL